MRTRIRELILLISGWFLLVLGVLGLFLPFLQGILFLIAGLAILSRVSPRFLRLWLYLRGRYPRSLRKFDEVKRKATILYIKGRRRLLERFGRLVGRIMPRRS